MGKRVVGGAVFPDDENLEMRGASPWGGGAVAVSVMCRHLFGDEFGKRWDRAAAVEAVIVPGRCREIERSGEMNRPGERRRD